MLLLRLKQGRKIRTVSPIHTKNTQADASRSRLLKIHNEVKSLTSSVRLYCACVRVLYRQRCLCLNGVYVYKHSCSSIRIESMLFALGLLGHCAMHLHCGIAPIIMPIVGSIYIYSQSRESDAPAFASRYNNLHACIRCVHCETCLDFTFHHLMWREFACARLQAKIELDVRCSCSFVLVVLGLHIDEMSLQCCDVRLLLIISPNAIH